MKINKIFRFISLVMLCFLLPITNVSCMEKKYNSDLVERIVHLYGKGKYVSFLPSDYEWTPDGSKIIFLAREIFGRDVVCSIEPDGKNLTYLTERGSPRKGFAPSSFSIAPDGKRIAVRITDYSTETNKIYVISLNSGKKEFLLEEKKPFLYPMEWSPDGERIGQEIYYEKLDIIVGEDVKSIGPFCFSPDGKWIAYGLPKEPDFWLEHTTTGEKFHIGNKMEGKVRSLIWSPDSSYLFFSTGKGWILDVSTLEKKLLGPRYPNFIFWSNSSKEILYEWVPSEVRVQNIETGEVKILGDGNSPKWSPDNSLIAYIFQGNIWVMKSDGTEKTKLTDFGEEERSCWWSPVWSPDGKKVLFCIGKEYKKQELWVLHLKGSEKDLLQ